MPHAKVIQKPLNWQDFERLCKKIFGEVWGCSQTIKANGRTGQSQNGVDIYGVPRGESKYFGVQCKGKDDYSNAELTQTEIDAEIAKAKSFKPVLASLAFATTANKDAKLEEYVRIIDERSRLAGEFAIQLYCWEDLADLIDEHRSVYDWWVREKRHRLQFEAKVCFEDGREEHTIRPMFTRTVTKYVVADKSPVQAQIGSLLGQLAIHPVVQGFAALEDRGIDRSWCFVDVTMMNAGQEVLDDYRFDFSFSDDCDAIDDEESHHPIKIMTVKRSFICWNEDLSAQYRPVDNSPLTQTDSRMFRVWLRPKPGVRVIDVSWNVFARDYAAAGKLSVKIEPRYIDEARTVVVEKSRPTKTEVEPYFEKKKK